MCIRDSKIPEESLSFVVTLTESPSCPFLCSVVSTLTALGATAFVATAQQPTPIGIAPGSAETERLEKKIIADLTDMIHQYDFSSAFNQAVTEEQARQVAWQAEYKPSVQELLGKLQQALAEDAQLEQMWPDARLKDKEMFRHLNFAFDLSSGTIKAETAAKDYHGVPIYQYVYDPSHQSAVEITNVEDNGLVQVELPPSALPVPPAATQTAAEATPATATTKIGSETDILTLEEQREVAFRVVAFFVMLIAASFALLYIYHRCSQSRVNNPAHKKTL